MPSIDWTWFLIGIAFAHFILPFLLGFVYSLIGSVKGEKAP